MDAVEFEETLGDSEVILDRLRALYEQFFQGIERLEPSVPRKDLDRKIDQLRRNIPRNTALRFRYHMLLQKYTTYQTYWRRVAKQIEEGTYRRDVMRARQRRVEARQEWDARRGGGWEIDVEVEDAIEAGTEGSPAPTSAPPPDRAPAPIVDDEVMSALRALEPMPTVPPRTVAPTLSPFALPSRRPATGEVPIAPPVVLAASPVPAEARPGTPAPPPPAASEPKTFKRPLPSNRPPTGEHPAASVRRTGEQPLSGVGSPVAGPVVPRGPRLPTAEYRATAAPVGPPGSSASAAIAEARIREVYDQYVEARKKNNERVDNVRYEAVRSSIEKMLPGLRAKHSGKQIDFEVVVKDGKVGLKPVAK